MWEGVQVVALMRKQQWAVDYVVRLGSGEALSEEVRQVRIHTRYSGLFGS
jgi:hypothetical protein